MTVCVVAIGSENIIFGASDRMLTAGDIQFEPQQQKIHPITNSIILQIAGDASIQGEIIRLVNIDVSARVQANPIEWLNVRDVAEFYRHHYENLRLSHSEHAILAPLGLDRNTWLTKQKDMEAGLVKNIASDLINYVFPSTAAIFSGIDTSGTHIYVIRDGTISCQDTVGFAAIGAGEWHASSQLMFAGHTRHKPVPETILSVYSAKKRAEVAPGVGMATDMFAIGPKPGSYASIVPEMLNDFEAIYQREQISHKDANEIAKGEVNQYVQKLAELAKQAAAEKQAAKPPDSGAGTTTNQT